MIDKLYDLFAKIGYVHPIHPAFTHGPIGAMMVAFGLALSVLLWRRHEQELLTSAYYTVIIAFVLLIPTVLVGILDWQHYYSGAWIFQVKMKIALASLLFVLLSITLIVGRFPNRRYSIMLVLFTLCLFNVLALGHIGGELVLCR
jgi:hypothetical protein